MAPIIDQAADLLFNTPGRRTLNVSFSIPPGARPTAEDLAQQIIEVERQIQSGEAQPVTFID